MAKIAGSTPGAVKYVDTNALAVDTVTTAGFSGAGNVSLNTGSTNAVAITDANTIAFTNLVLGGN